jgi:hypothetical protein
LIGISGEATIAGHALTPGSVWCVPARSEAFVIDSAHGCDVLVTYPSVSPTPGFYELSETI